MKISEDCKEVRDKICFFNDLQENEKNIVLNHIVSCNNCNMFYSKMDQINQIVGNHLDLELLSAYTVFKFHPNEKDYNGKSFSKAEIEKVNRHLRICNVCRAKFNEMELLYSDMIKWSDSNIPNVKIKPFIENERATLEEIGQRIKTLLKNRLHTKLGYRLLATVTSIFIILAIIFFDFKSSSINDLAKLEEISIPISIRSGETSMLQKGILSFNHNNYLKAISQFEHYINNNKGAKDNTYARYLLGLSYLKSVSEESGTNLPFLEKGIIQFKTVLAEVDNPSLKENVLWYLGKAYLIKKDILKAKQYYELINDLGGSRASASRVILDKLGDFN